mgnify:CR=1 FL=1
MNDPDRPVHGTPPASAADAPGFAAAMVELEAILHRIEG